MVYASFWNQGALAWVLQNVKELVRQRKGEYQQRGPHVQRCDIWKYTLIQAKKRSGTRGEGGGKVAGD